MTSLLTKWFGFDPKQMSLRTEILAGLTTFMTMSYILAVNPDILSAASMDKSAVFTATALASAAGTVLMAFLAKLPLAQAPGMGINAFFAFTIVLGMGYTWEAALTAVFMEGIIFILLTIFNIRSKVVDCIPLNLRYAISVGIGMFIAFIGLKNAGIIVGNEATLVTRGHFNATSALAVISILISAVLIWKKVKGALFYGIIICTLIGIPMGITHIPGDFVPISTPPSVSPTFFKFDFAALLDLDMIVIVLILVFLDLFNTLGTLVAAGSQAGIMDENGNFPQMKGALMSDAIATSVGAIFGTSTVTTYVESSAGIAEGGRSGVTAAVTGLLFLLSLFLAPIFLLVPSAATTGALLAVGVMMTMVIKDMNFSEVSESFPAFVTLLTMVLTYSIADGIGYGLIVYTLVKVFTGQFRAVTPTLYVVSILLICYYVFH
ncbi:MAG: NCS2 family permease [Tannerellaceae bacterium]|jgi:AGZA family xanthine/uracil permease-like MFS transporter|nr:NCS2 family permease [Tannerellaceae bacterium]